LKSCPTCHRQYLDDTLGFCLDDGVRLVEAFDSAATWVNPPRRDTDPPGDDSEITRVAVRPQYQSEPTIVARPASSPNYEQLPNPSYTPPPEPPKPGRGPWMWIALALGLVLVLGLGVVGVAAIVYFNGSSSPVSNNASTPKPTPSATATPTPTPEATATPTPGEAVSFTGTWSGNWTNSKGESGRSTISVTENGDGTISGGEGNDFVMANGRRTGDVLTWDYVGAGDTCFDYKCVFIVDPSTMTGRGTFTVTDSCQDTTFTGTYVEYSLDSSD
jgi:hypothetical protein